MNSEVQGIEISLIKPFAKHRSKCVKIQSRVIILGYWNHIISVAELNSLGKVNKNKDFALCDEKMLSLAWVWKTIFA